MSTINNLHDNKQAEQNNKIISENRPVDTAPVNTSSNSKSRDFDSGATQAQPGETSTASVLIEDNGTVLIDGIQIGLVGPLSQSSSLCNSVVSTAHCHLSHASSLTSMKSTDTNNTTTTTSSSSLCHTNSSDDLDQSSSDDHSGTRPILKQPTGPAGNGPSLLSRLTAPTILTSANTAKLAPQATTATAITTATTTTIVPTNHVKNKSNKLKPKSNTTTATNIIKFQIDNTNYDSNNDRATTLSSGRSSRRHHQRAPLSGALLGLGQHGQQSLSSSSSLDHHSNNNNDNTMHRRREQQNAGGSHRIYKNSPFGLTRHYLSMPGSGEDEQDLQPEVQPTATKLITIGTAETSASAGEQQLVSTISGGQLAARYLGLNEDDDLRIAASEAQQPQQQQTEMGANQQQQQQQQEKLMMLIPDSASQLAAKMKRASFGQLPGGGGGSGGGDDDDDVITGCNSRRQKEAKHSIAGCSGKTSGSSAASCSKTEAGSEKKKKHQQQARSSTLLVKFCSIIYATFLIILGCILHIAELRQKSRNSSDHIYSSVVALIGILWLTFLHFDLQRYKNYACKFILIESIFNDHHQGDNDLRQQQSSSRSVSGQSLDKMSMNTEVIFKRTAQHLSSQAAAIQAMRQANSRRERALSKAQIKRMSMNDIQQYEQQQVQQHQAYNDALISSASSSTSSNSNSNSVLLTDNNNSNNRKMSSAMLLNGFQSSPTLNQNNHDKTKSSSSLDSSLHNQLLVNQHNNGPGSSLFDRRQSNSNSSNINHINNYYHNDNQLIDDDLVPAYRFLHGKMGANFYLKCGMAAFCFGHVIHEGLRFGQQVYFFMTDNYPCQDVAALVAHLITPLYSFYQLFMMFKYSNLVINRFKTVAYFGLMHIIGTSITFWFRTILEEAFEDFVHKMDYFKQTSAAPQQAMQAGFSLSSPLPATMTTMGRPAGADFGQNKTSLMGASGGPVLVSLFDMASNLLLHNNDTVISSQQTRSAMLDGNVERASQLGQTGHMGQMGQMGQTASKSNSFLDTTPSSLFGLASENNYLASLLSNFYTDHIATASSALSTSNLYPDSSIDQDTLLLDGGRSVNVANVIGGGHLNHLKLNSNDAINPDEQGVISESIAQSLMTLMSSPVSATISPQLASHLPGSYACAQNTLLTTKSMNALPYLYPFTIEYNLLLAATFLGLYFNIGRLSSSGCSNHPFRRELVHNYENGKEELEYKSNFVVNADCHAANKGLFCGFFVLLVTLVSIVIFFVTINKPQHVQLGIKINLIQETTLTVLILLVTLAGFRQVVKLNRNACLKDKVTTDDVLMLVPLPFFFIHSLLSFRAEMASISSGKSSSLNPTLSNNTIQHNLTSGAANHLLMHQSPIIRLNNTNNRQADNLTKTLANHLIQNVSNLVSNHSSQFATTTAAQQQQQPFDYFKLITISLHVLVMIEVLVQTNFIIDGMRRCSQSRYLRFKKPGRELITFAILLNITYWIVATFESKSVEQYQTEIDFYGPLPWMFVSHTTLPVMLFYRYHSSVCLAEIWGRAYKPAKKVG